MSEGNLEQALAEQEKQFNLAQKINDPAAMSVDLATMGNILLEAGKPDRALEKFNLGLKTVENSDLSEQVKENTRQGHLFNTARVALAKEALEKSKTNAKAYRKLAESRHNANQIRLANELEGQIALGEKQYDIAIQTLKKANQLNPYNIYRLALAYRGKGDRDQTQELSDRAANFNALNSLNQAFIRQKAQKLSGK